MSITTGCISNFGQQQDSVFVTARKGCCTVFETVYHGGPMTKGTVEVALRGVPFRHTGEMEHLGNPHSSLERAKA